MRTETIAGLLLAAFALSSSEKSSSEKSSSEKSSSEKSSSEDPLEGAALSEELHAAARACLASLGLTQDAEQAHERKPRALHALASAAAEPALERLPQNARAAALLAPLASASARAHAGALPIPRRGYRAPQGLRDHLRRLAATEHRSARADEERARMEARPWRG